MSDSGLSFELAAHSCCRFILGVLGEVIWLDLGRPISDVLCRSSGEV